MELDGIDLGTIPVNTEDGIALPTVDTGDNDTANNDVVDDTIHQKIIKIHKSQKMTKKLIFKKA